MRKELEYEYTSLPPAQKAFKCVCDRLGITAKEEDMSGYLIARSEDRSFSARLITRTTERGLQRVEVRIRVSDEEQMTAVVACFGEAKQERQIAPSAKNFASTVLETELKEDTEGFITEICEKLEIPRERFGSYRAMILSSSKMKGAPDDIKEAAKRLKEI